MKKKLKEFANSRWFYVFLLGLLTTGVAAAGIVSMRRSDMGGSGPQGVSGESLPQVAVGTRQRETAPRQTESRKPEETRQTEERQAPTRDVPETRDLPETQDATQADPGNRTARENPPESESPQRSQEPVAGEEPVDAPGGSGRIFNEAAGLVWPVNGRLLREFSMDTTVYYPTLDAYKVSPALVLQAEPGSEVRAAADGVIKEIGHNEEIGHYVVVDIGSDCELIYGQLTEPTYVTGVEVRQGDVIATVAEPTIYYSLEGPNLYFGMKKAGIPADPLDYMDVE